jgi:glycosyltransferase involved in cell wall biosynthesis
MIVEESGCGLVASPKDYGAIAELLAKFIRREADISGMGAAGRAFLEKNLTKDISIGRYAEEIEKL